jgi:two-component system, chemotaxis family, protein-glutamate methylesterase/glutaminase
MSAFLQSDFDVVAIGASLGGPTVMSTILHVLPAEFPVPILIVQHARAIGSLVEILQRVCALEVKSAVKGESLRAGVVYGAPGGSHFTVTPGRTCQLDESAPISFARPSIDCLFESVARTYGSRALVIVLTGGLKDGTQGAALIRAAGGLVMVQDPATCRAPSMPQSVIDAGAMHLRLTPGEIADTLQTLVMVPGTRALLALPAPSFS